MSALYRKRPIPVEARQLTDESFRGLVDALTVEQFAAGGEDSDGYMFIEIRTLEGVVRAKDGDWIVWGNHDDVWPVKGSIFAETYEPAETGADLAKLRAAALRQVREDTGEACPRWRVIITDSESPTGVAPVCAGGRSDALHMIDDYPGGPKRDGEGVYDCCPWPQFDTYSPAVAAYLVALLNADATRAGEGR